MQRWQPGHSYWISTAETAEILGVTPTRVKQLSRRGRLPAVRFNGRWFLRRQQVEVIANPREARVLSG